MYYSSIFFTVYDGPNTLPYVAPRTAACTHMSLCVQGVVGELGVMKGDGAALPVGAGGGRVRVDEDPVGQPGLRRADGLPAAALKAVAGVICREDVQQEDVAERRVQTRQF